MRRIVIGALLALALFVVAGLCWQEAGRSRRAADAHERLATLRYDSDDGVDAPSWIWRQVRWLSGTSDVEAAVHRATVGYWLGRYDALTEAAAPGSNGASNPSMLLVAANALYRSQPLPSDRKAAVERLDTVVQAYADALRRDPSLTDAAYNFEYLSRLRDGVSRQTGGRAAPKGGKPAAEDVSIDLPSGPTVHGRPGAPPEGTVMSQFKTITPMRYDEREEQVQPGRGKEFRRKG